MRMLQNQPSGWEVASEVLLSSRGAVYGVELDDRRGGVQPAAENARSPVRTTRARGVRRMAYGVMMKCCMGPRTDPHDQSIMLFRLAYKAVR